MQHISPIRAVLNAKLTIKLVCVLSNRALWEIQNWRVFQILAIIIRQKHKRFGSLFSLRFFSLKRLMKKQNWVSISVERFNAPISDN